MSLPPAARRRHSIANALGKTRLALQLLEHQPTFSTAEYRMVQAALEGLEEIDAILRDDADRILIGQPITAGRV
jgi:hypothetical protein